MMGVMVSKMLFCLRLQRAAGLLNVLLPMSSDATHEVVRNGIVKKLLKILKVENIGLSVQNSVCKEVKSN